MLALVVIAIALVGKINKARMDTSIIMLRSPSLFIDRFTGSSFRGRECVTKV